MTVPDLAAEISRRRTFAIISHPDAGKTTLTEKLLLYGGAIHLAGSVKARRAERHVTSDWMALERQRGISVTSSVLQFPYGGRQINLLDTPGHQDFSEDTYRTLIAADSAVMLLDNRKGVEERTRQLFDVCRRRRLPIVTLVNKCDRPGTDPLQLLSDVEADLGLACVPMTWPVYRDSALAGVFHRGDAVVHLFDRGADHGARQTTSRKLALDHPDLAVALGVAAVDRLRLDIDLLEAASAPFSKEAFLAGELSPMYFGSALTNLGIEPFFRAFVELAPPPSPREANIGMIEPIAEAFTGFVFKIQANMDPRHRDRIAFIRIVSGRFEAGMSVVHARTGKSVRLAAPQQFLARERTAIETAWPGDVVGIHDRGQLRVGDTLAAEPGVTFHGIPHFAPEHFARVLVKDPLRRKHLDTGLRQLSDEGAAQVFYTDGLMGPAPIVGAVGLLQFDVLLFRMENEYNVPCALERMPHTLSRWVAGEEEDIHRLARGRGRTLVFDSKNNPMLLFEDQWSLRSVLEHEKDVQLLEAAP